MEEKGQNVNKSSAAKSLVLLSVVVGIILVTNTPTTNHHQPPAPQDPCGCLAKARTLLAGWLACSCEFFLPDSAGYQPSVRAWKRSMGHDNDDSPPHTMVVPGRQSEGNPEQEQELERVAGDRPSRSVVEVRGDDDLLSPEIPLQEFRRIQVEEGWGAGLSLEDLALEEAAWDPGERVEGEAEEEEEEDADTDGSDSASSRSRESELEQQRHLHHSPSSSSREELVQGMGDKVKGRSHSRSRRHTSSSHRSSSKSRHRNHHNHHHHHHQQKRRRHPSDASDLDEGAANELTNLPTTSPVAHDAVPGSEERAHRGRRERPHRGSRRPKRQKPSFSLCPRNPASRMFLVWVGHLILCIHRVPTLVGGGPEAFPFCMRESERSSSTGDALKKAWLRERKHQKE
jgi:hypothetical protein